MRKLFKQIVHRALAALISLPLAVHAAGNDQHGPAQSAALIANTVIEFLDQQASNYPGSAHITVDSSKLLQHPACDELQAFLPGSQRLRARMSVGVRCLGPRPWTARVSATLAIEGFFYVPNRTLEPGETVSLDDIIAREGDILSLGRGVLVDPSQLIDYVVTRRIPAGTPIKAHSLRSPMSVERGQTVRTQARGRGFVVTSEAQTLEGGSPGEQIRVRTGSGQVITATVMDAHTVQVMM